MRHELPRNDFEDCGDVLIDDVMASTLIDRLVHHCHIVNIRGNSYRMRQYAVLHRRGQPADQLNRLALPAADALLDTRVWLVLSRRRMAGFEISAEGSSGGNARGVYDDAELRLPVREVPQAVRGGAADLRAYRPLARLPQVQVPPHTPGARAVLREDREEELMFERLRAALQAALKSATPPPERDRRTHRRSHSVPRQS